MNVKLDDLVNSENALAVLAQADVSARMSFTLALVLKEVGSHLDAKRAAHLKLLEKYGTPREKQPGAFNISPEHKDAFDKELKDLLETEVTLNGIGKIRASALETEGVKLSGGQRLALSWMLKEDTLPMFETE